jgi:hypothetical protein
VEAKRCQLCRETKPAASNALKMVVKASALCWPVAANQG